VTRRPDAPPERPAARRLALPCAAAFLAGAACVLGFAPFYAWPVPMLAMALLAGIIVGKIIL